MKTKIAIITAFVASIFMLQSASGQGALTPPGAPAPVMKTLSQIEPRTPISSAPFTISASGSYYLTTNLTISSGTAISVNANNVTLDLNGFTISSTETPAASSVGILLGSSVAVTNVTIVHGFISGGVTNNSSGTYGGSGFADGISYSGLMFPFNVRISGVSVSGCLYEGISPGNNNSVVESCTVNTVGNYGIFAQTVSDSTAQNCGNYGVYAYGTANNCTGNSSGNGNGVNATTANNCYGTCSGFGYAVDVTTANNCYGYNAGSGTGVYASATANNCYGYSSGSGYGIYGGNIATGCNGYSATGTGLYAFIASVCHGATSSGTPLSATHNVNSF